ncbi:MAG: polysaccharide lyase [Bacteroidota bacterium]
MLLLIFSACKETVITSCEQTFTDSIPVLNSNFDDGLPDDQWNYQVATDSSIQILDKPERNGYALRMMVQPGDIAIQGDQGTGKNRAEIAMKESTGDRYPVNSEVWYSWEFMVPEDYEYSETSFQIIGQFHHRGTGSPSIAIHYGEDELRDQDGIAIFHRRNLEDPATEITRVEIEKGKWNQMIWHVRWSIEEDGFFESWLNGERITVGTFYDENGKVFAQNSYDCEPKVLKLGLYRGPGFTTRNVVWFDNIRIGNSYEEVE